MSETNATHFIDRTGWRPGPWDTEPDRVEFAHAGLTCLIGFDGVRLAGCSKYDPRLYALGQQFRERYP